MRNRVWMTEQQAKALQRKTDFVRQFEQSVPLPAVA